MSDSFDQYFLNLKPKTVAVLGLGISNRPLVRLLLEYGCRVLACDRTPREKLEPEVLELERLGAELHTGDGYLKGISPEVVFRTPGMHPNNTDLEALRAKGAEVTSEMETFFELCPCTILAVTGSDGKTTTTTLIAEMLKTAGKTVWVGGNIGQPLLPRCRQMLPGDYAVVELSSFQLMDMKRSPHIAVVTNVAPNHLDVHKDMAEYVWAKQAICRYQTAGDILVVNHDNAIAAGFHAPGERREFSRQVETPSGVYLKDGIVYRSRLGHTEQVLRQQEILLPGLHNVENYMAAIAAVEGLVPDDAIRRVARTFGGVEHRIELVREKDGVRYYNDSIASSPSRTIAGLRSFNQKVILIAGGYDKHIPYDVLGPEICTHVKRLIVTGATGPKIKSAVLQAGEAGYTLPEILDIPDFDAAVHAAAASAKEGDVVILSPASAAFDHFKNFMVRGAHFKDLISKL